MRAAPHRLRLPSLSLITIMGGRATASLSVWIGPVRGPVVAIRGCVMPPFVTPEWPISHWAQITVTHVLQSVPLGTAMHHFLRLQRAYVLREISCRAPDPLSSLRCATLVQVLVFRLHKHSLFATALVSLR